jgi:mycofactocin precursor
MDENKVDAATKEAEVEPSAEGAKVTEVLILEEISIDSMCGVY